MMLLSDTWGTASCFVWLTSHHWQTPSHLSHTSVAWIPNLYKQHGLSSHQAAGDWSGENINMDKIKTCEVSLFIILIWIMTQNAETVKTGIISILPLRLSSVWWFSIFPCFDFIYNFADLDSQLSLISLDAAQRSSEKGKVYFNSFFWY